jgi:hypothetical protein
MPETPCGATLRRIGRSRRTRWPISEPTLRSDPAASPGVCATASTSSSCTAGRNRRSRQRCFCGAAVPMSALPGSSISSTASLGCCSSSISAARASGGKTPPIRRRQSHRQAVLTLPGCDGQARPGRRRRGEAPGTSDPGEPLGWLRDRSAVVFTQAAARSPSPGDGQPLGRFQVTHSLIRGDPHTAFAEGDGADSTTARSPWLLRRRTPDRAVCPRRRGARRGRAAERAIRRGGRRQP